MNRLTSAVSMLTLALCAGVWDPGQASAHQAVDPAILSQIQPGESLAGVGRPDLIERGRRLFENETFGGNGRTCATCHPADNNFTIDPAFIARLPRRDPLFVAEFNPRLRELENPYLMRRFGLILENLDGFEQPGVLRSVPHTLGMSQTTKADTGSSTAGSQAGGPGPVGPRAGGEANATGWSHDGSPGDGSLRSFAVGAVIQHFPKRLDRVPGVDFRLPTEAELEAMLAFQLSLGRQAELVEAENQDFQDDRVDLGRKLFFTSGSTPDEKLAIRNGGDRDCGGCHRFAGSNDSSNVNRQRTTGANHHPNAPACRGDAPGDGGHGRDRVVVVSRATLCGSGTGDVVFRGNDFFNPPSLIEAADTGPFFHNNLFNTLEDAVAFYETDAFNDNREDDANGVDRAFVFQPGQVEALGAYLRAINAVENARQARVYIEQSTGKPIGVARRTIRLAIADTEDAIEVLTSGPVPLFTATDPVAAFREALVALRLALRPNNPNALPAADTALARAASLMLGS
jgi:cytochrome c peroxidase